MLQGFHKKIKQPIAHYFVKGTISTQTLVSIIKTAIRAVHEAGYKVIATVCDQGPTNVGAMNLLKNLSGEPAESNYFMLDDEKVFIVYDVPHLFKSLRNNFLEGGLLKMDNKTAKWTHLVELQEKNQSTLHFTKITKAHVSPKYRTKMKVKLAAQILSNTTAAILKLLAESAENKEKNKEILETAHIVEDLDRLFDCTNGPSSHKDIKKGIRQNVTKNSYHHECWIKYKKKLKTLHFLKSNSQLRLRNVRCVNGYITTISSLQDIWKYVESKNFKYLNLRQCNQDSLENLFGIIRQHSPTNNNPTCHHFTAALKSAILTRLSTPTSRGSNCEKDENEILFDFHDIVFAKKHDQKEECKSTSVDLLSDHHLQNLNESIPYVLHIPEEQNFEHEMEEMEEMFKGFDKQPTVYVSGYLAKVLLKDVTCQKCIKSMKVSFPKPNSIYNYIAFREWWNDETSLTYPTLQLCEAIDNATKIFESEVATRLHVRDICKYAITVMICGTNLSWMCGDHQATMTDRLLRRLSLLLIRNECRIKNRMFAELEDPLADTVKKGQQQGISK
ncbi:uncharacterized protein LOC134795013 [Cydia splendana]|uniref:uncharacterized protein LOC134795013 n=1 Tax=Cydia splendana TaxID=1100963 RepID=UPI00300C2F98